jgi:hypothetical protein
VAHREDLAASLSRSPIDLEEVRRRLTAALNAIPVTASLTV